MHFDDSMDTVLAGDISTASARHSSWRQLVDLIGRRRASAAPAALDRLAQLRPHVAAEVRAASARALVFADPPAALVALFAGDELAVATPVLRSARIADADWIALLPGLSPGARAILRHRRDLSGDVARALEAFGPVDFQLPAAASAEPSAGSAVVAETSPEVMPAEQDPAVVAEDPIDPATPVEPDVLPVEVPVAAAPPATSFVSIGDAALSVPGVAEALRSLREAPAPATGEGGFEIAELVQRIDRFQRDRDGPRSFGLADEPDEPAVPSDGFRFETDADGIVRWVWGVARAATIGLAFGTPAPAGSAGVDGVAAGAFRQRAAFADARLVIAGASDAAGQWRISAVPAFDPASGRFTGYRGTARRPRADEQAEPRRGSPAADSLRQLVHELRTPTTAIIGFAEMIETELLGPVGPPYRERAATIRRHTEALLGAIEDLDMAARVEGGTLELRPRAVRLQPLVATIVADLAPLAEMRGVTVAVDPFLPARAVTGDERIVERLIGRLLAALVATAAAGERIGVAVTADGPDAVAIGFDRPAALAAFGGDALFAIDAESEDEAGAPLLGTGFALRLARNLARELGGSLAIGAERLTLRLPAADHQPVGQLSFN